MEFIRESLELADFNWDNLVFELVTTDYMFMMKCSQDGKFTKGELQRYGNIELSPSSGVLNYGQVCYCKSLFCYWILLIRTFDIGLSGVISIFWNMDMKHLAGTMSLKSSTVATILVVGENDYYTVLHIPFPFTLIVWKQSLFHKIQVVTQSFAPRYHFFFFQSFDS